MRLISFILSIFFISGCAYNVKTNVDDFVLGTIEKNIKSTGVQELTPRELHQRYFLTLGAVETLLAPTKGVTTCQTLEK